MYLYNVFIRIKIICYWLKKITSLIKTKVHKVKNVISKVRIEYLYIQLSFVLKRKISFSFKYLIRINISSI